MDKIIILKNDLIIRQREITKRVNELDEKYSDKEELSEEEAIDVMHLVVMNETLTAVIDRIDTIMMQEN